MSLTKITLFFLALLAPSAGFADITLQVCIPPLITINCNTPTPTATPTISPTVTITSSPTNTPIATATPAATLTPTLLPTETPKTLIIADRAMKLLMGGGL